MRSFISKIENFYKLNAHDRSGDNLFSPVIKELRIPLYQREYIIQSPVNYQSCRSVIQKEKEDTCQEVELCFILQRKSARIDHSRYKIDSSHQYRKNIDRNPEYRKELVTRSHVVYYPE